MSALVSITTPSDLPGNADLATHQIRTMPVVVISPHNQCNCRCVMCDIWRIREPKEITPSRISNGNWLHSVNLGVRWVVFTGGEPQMNSQLSSLARMVRAEGIRVTLLTAGLLLESHAESIAATIDDVIVSLDGPTAVHNHIRRVPDAFERMTAGIAGIAEVPAGHRGERTLHGPESKSPLALRCGSIGKETRLEFYFFSRRRPYVGCL